MSVVESPMNQDFLRSIPIVDHTIDQPGLRLTARACNLETRDLSRIFRVRVMRAVIEPVDIGLVVGEEGVELGVDGGELVLAAAPRDDGLIGVDDGTVAGMILRRRTPGNSRSSSGRETWPWFSFSTPSRSRKIAAAGCLNDRWRRGRFRCRAPPLPAVQACRRP
jgi:hypothetical protein